MTKHGIDVSKFQGIIDFEELKNHVDFVIIRCGYGQDIESQDDPMYKRNVEECIRLKIPFGVYLYSYARNEADALSEANHVLRLVKDYQIPYPIFYDLEDFNTVGRQSNEMIAKIAQTFCRRLEENNYYVGIYASYSWFKTKLTNPIFNNYTKWIARYNDELNYDGHVGMWQYSQTGRILGIDTFVDKDYCYEDYPSIIEGRGLNNFNKDENMTYHIKDEVQFRYVFLTSESSQPLIPYRNYGTITRIIPHARNPYLIDQDAGWVNNQVIEKKIRYLKINNYHGNSIVDALKEIGEDSSFESRSKLARDNGIENYQGTQKQNEQLLELLKEGKLKA